MIGPHRPCSERPEITYIPVVGNLDAVAAARIIRLVCDLRVQEDKRKFIILATHQTRVLPDCIENMQELLKIARYNEMDVVGVHYQPVIDDVQIYNQISGFRLFLTERDAIVALTKHDHRPTKHGED